MRFIEIGKTALVVFLVLNPAIKGKSLESTESRLPDLTVSISLSPQDPCVNETVTFTAQVRNNGTATAPASKLRLTIGGGPAQILAVPPIDPGKYQNVTTTSVFSVAQRYLATAVADYDQKIAESNEGNNTKSKSFEVNGNCCPDLVPHRMWVWPANPTTDTIFSVNVWIRNIGRRPSSPTQLDVYVGGAGKPYTFPVPTIHPGDERMFKQDVIIDKAGKYRAKFVIDPQNHVAECDEQNNTRFLDFTVKR